MAYPVIPTKDASEAMSRLPRNLYEALYAALMDAAQGDPWALPRYDETAMPHMRLLPWAGGAHMALLLIAEKRDPEPALILLATSASPL